MNGNVKIAIQYFGSKKGAVSVVGVRKNNGYHKNAKSATRCQLLISVRTVRKGTMILKNIIGFVLLVED